MPDPALRDRVAATSWYHSIELEPGLVTPGWFDTRPLPRRLPFPASLADRRCLDVGTFDGFWAFEMEKRGAAEVVAVDVLDPHRWDWPAGSPPEVIEEMESRKRDNPGFAIAKEALGSQVRLVDETVYELDPDELGRFDFIFCGSLLLHLRDPVRGVESLRRLSDGEVMVTDAVDPFLSRLFRGRPVTELDGRGRPWWFHQTASSLKALVERGGFRVVEGPRRYAIPRGPAQRRPPLRPKVLLSRHGRELMRDAVLGSPHAVVRAVPA
ncbi:MAG: class I SAM-dependent methyltransferase [Thermoleophilaceae bacterium]